MDEVKRYAIFVTQAIKESVMETANQFQYGSSWPVKFYFCLLHILLLSLVFYIFLKSRKKDKDDKSIRRRGTRTFTKDNRAVTSETCEWLNSTLAWLYLHSDSKNTPDLVKLWIRNLNRELYKTRKNNQRIFITNIRPGCLPPKLTSVYCLCVDGTMQCITFHVESTELGFHVHVNQPVANGTSKNVILEVNVVKLVGEVALQLNNTPPLFEVKMMFIGEPEIRFSTRSITKGIYRHYNMGQGTSQEGVGNEVVEKTEEKKLQCSIKTSVEETNGDGIDAAAVEAVEEKLKEVICKTVTNVPLAESPTKTEPGSSGTKDKLESPILQTCLGEEGKLLVKVIKATGLCAKETSGAISPYCIIWTDHPYQRKRTSLIKDTDSPFWNEYFAFEITSKTREITLNIFDFENTSPDVNYHMDDNELSPEQDDFLGQAIVPLATINRNQTCRLILPILPKTNKCNYVKGELSLEFTFDKDGKVINGALPLVDGTDNKPKTPVEESVESKEVDKPQETAPVEDTPSGSFHRSYGPAYSYSLDKSYMETSLDELAQEIEAYEAGSKTPVEENKSVELLMEMKPDTTETEKQPEPEPVQVVDVTPVEAVVAETPKEGEDVEDNKTEETKEEKKEEKKEEEHKEESPENKPKTKKSFASKFKRRPKSTIEGEKKPEEDVDTKRHSYHAGDKAEEDQETKEEEKEEEKEKEGEKEKREAEDHTAPSELTTEPKSKIRRSFNMKFKRGHKKDDKEKEKESLQETDALKVVEPTDESKEQAAMEESLQSDPPKSRFGRFKRSKDTKHEPKDEEKENKEERQELETVDENAESGTPPEKPAESKPKLRKLNLRRGKQRPVSMSAADKPASIDEEGKLDRDDQVRHSYHAGDLPPPPPLRKSTSESSLLSYSPNPYSSLVIEVTEKDQKTYYHVPVAMAKRGTYEQKGVKYHVYNDHMFRATHLEPSTDCAVCGKTIFGRFGKQGYQCIDCKMTTHKKCHFETSEMCSNSSIKNIEIKDLDDQEGK